MLGVVTWAGGARAESIQETADPTSPRIAPSGAPGDAEEGNAEAEEDTFSHAMQAGLRVGVVGAYRVVMRYDASPLCRAPELEKPVKDQQKLCGFMGPPALDLALSFAPFAGLEPFLWARFGLGAEDATETEPLLLFGAGLRAYTMSDSRFKIFIEPAVAFTAEGGTGATYQFANATAYQPDYKGDLQFHLAAGPQYDFAKVFGVYLSAGTTVGVLRSINASMEFGGGVQLRLP